MRIPRTVISTVALLIVIGISIVFSFGIFHDYHQRRQAEQLLNVLQQVQVGSTVRATVVQMTSPFQRYADVFHAGDQLNFVFYNKWLHRLRFAPHVEVRVWIAFNDAGVVVDKRAWELVSTTGCAVEVVERKQGVGLPKGFPIPPNHKVIGWPDVLAADRARG